MKKRKLGGRRRAEKALIYIILLVCCVCAVFPFYWMFVIGSNTTSAVNQFPPVMVPGSNFFVNFKNATEKISFWRALGNSAVIAATVTVCVLLSGAMAGYAFGKLRFRGKNILFLLLVGTMMVPQQLAIVPNYILINHLGLLNTKLGVIFPNMVTAFGVFWMKQNVEAIIPDEMLEAARIDGCGYLRQFGNMVLPLLRTPLATLGIITFMAQWNDFTWPLIVLQKEGSRTIQIALRNLFGVYISDYSMILAATCVSVLPILAVFFLFSRQFVSSVTAGAVKA